MATIDLGLALSHDAIHFHEPIPSYKFVPAREQPESEWGVPPALIQGQGMENVGDRTLYWYSLWRGTQGSGVRLASWERDRLGMLKPFSPDSPKTVTCPIEVVSGRPGVFVNASGLGEQCQLRLSLLDEGFRPIPGCSGDDEERRHYRHGEDATLEQAWVDDRLARRGQRFADRRVDPPAVPLRFCRAACGYFFFDATHLSASACASRAHSVTAAFGLI